MPISNPIFGGLKRAFFSHKAIANTALNANVLVLNPLAGTKAMGPSKPDILANANSAQGQGEWTTKMSVGANHLLGQHKYWLTSQSLGMIAAMSCPSGTVAGGGGVGAYVHEASVKSTNNILRPHTVQENYRGATQTNQAYLIKAAIGNGFEIEVLRGNQWATITMDLIGNEEGVATNLSAIDIDANAPLDIATPPTKCGLWLAPTTGNNHTMSYDGTIGSPSAAGTPFEDLTGQFMFSMYARNYRVAFTNNLNEADLFIAGLSSGTGFIANTATAYANKRLCTLTMTLDLNAAAGGPVALMEYLRNFTNALQQSYSMQFTFVNDVEIASSGIYHAGTIVVPAMRLVTAEPSTDLGPMFIDVTMEAMIDYANTGHMLTYTFDGVATDYHATV